VLPIRAVVVWQAKNQIVRGVVNPCDKLSHLFLRVQTQIYSGSSWNSVSVWDVPSVGELFAGRFMICTLTTDFMESFDHEFWIFISVLISFDFNIYKLVKKIVLQHNRIKSKERYRVYHIFARLYQLATCGFKLNSLSTAPLTISVALQQCWIWSR